MPDDAKPAQSFSTARCAMPASINILSLGLFVVSATALLGSLGPGVAFLLAIGRAAGVVKSLAYFCGLQVGLAGAAGLCATGVFSLLDLIPGALQGMSILAAIYLLYLAYQTVRAPVGAAVIEGMYGSSFSAGLLFGLSNPKAFVAFVSLFASQKIWIGDPRADSTMKWLLIVSIMIVVDLIWLLIGASLRRTAMTVGMERALNLSLGTLIVVTTLSTFL
jgi:threonine/homoserine/homoserine lactone efflux protein